MTYTHSPDAATVDALKSIAASLPDGELRLQGVATPLPGPVAAMLREILTTLAAGEPVALITSGTEMTPNEAAEFLNVSRGFVTRLMDEGVLAYHQVGSHRRISGAAVAAYKEAQQVRSRAAMAELARHSQEMGLYDDPPDMPPKAAFKTKGGQGR